MMAVANEKQCADDGGISRTQSHGNLSTAAPRVIDPTVITIFRL